MLYCENALTERALFLSVFMVFQTLFLQAAVANEKVSTENLYVEFTREVSAKEVLPHTLKSRLKGEYHEVNNRVVNIAGLNVFTIESKFGELKVEGNYLLLKRINEFSAIAALSSISRGGAFVDSQVDAAKASVNVASEAVLNPVETISNLPKGFMRVFTSAYDDAKEIGKLVTGETDAKAAIGEGVGASSAIRGIAKDYGTDPYTRNVLLQEEMNRLAWFMATGKKAQEYTEKIVDKVEKEGEQENKYKQLYDITLPKLKEKNRETLKNTGLRKEDYSSLLNNSSYIASELYFMANALESMSKVKNIDLLTKSAGQARTVDEAIFYYRSCELLSLIHQHKGGIEEIILLNLVPTALMADKRLIIVTPVDYALLYDTDHSEIDKFIQSAKKISATGLEVWIEGTAPDEVISELAAKGIKTVTLAFNQFK